MVYFGFPMHNSVYIASAFWFWRAEGSGMHFEYKKRTSSNIFPSDTNRGCLRALTIQRCESDGEIPQGLPSFSYRPLQLLFLTYDSSL